MKIVRELTISQLTVFAVTFLQSLKLQIYFFSALHEYGMVPLPKSSILQVYFIKYLSNVQVYF